MCEAAEHGIDLADPSVSEQLLRVYADAIGDWGISAGGWVAPAGAQEDPLLPEARALIRSLKRDGAPVDDEGKLAVRATALALPDLPAEDVDRQAVMVVYGRNEPARRAMFNFFAL